MSPVYTFKNIFIENNITEHNCITASFALCAVILAFMYFALGWATNRMKEAEDTSLSGSPALICWTSSMGILCFTILGTHFFASLFFVLNTNIYLWHFLPFFAMLYICYYFWRPIISNLILHKKYKGELDSFSKEMLVEIREYRKGFWGCILSILLIGWFTFFETLFGNLLSGIMGICFFLISVAGLGSHISLTGDLFPRAVKSNEKLDG